MFLETNPCVVLYVLLTLKGLFKELLCGLGSLAIVPTKSHSEFRTQAHLFKHSLSVKLCQPSVDLVPIALELKTICWIST